MPKIVDHEKKRQEIALKAAGIFLELGYKNLGMRQLCTELDMSKSAIYHYFNSKDEIFRAATEAMVSLDGMTLSQRPQIPDANVEERIENFNQIFSLLAPRHFQETKLVMEYIDVIGVENIAQDTCMKMVNDKYQTLLAQYVDVEKSEQLYTLLLGLLNQQLVQGCAFSDGYIANLLHKHIH